MFVKDFVENNDFDFPDMFLRSLPTYCFDCGSPMEISDVLTGLHCSNPRCNSKVAQRLYTLCQMLGVKDLGKKRAESFINKFGIDNPLLIFAYEPDSDGCMSDSISLELSNKIVNQFKDKRNFTLSEFVRVANLPYLQTSCSHIFGDYDSLEEAYNDIERGGLDFICDKLSIKKGSNDISDSGEISIRALKIYQVLMLYKTDLFEALPFVNIIEVNKNRNNSDMVFLKAVCSDEVGYPYHSKNEFYSDANSISSNIHIEFLQSVTKGIDYLIWAGADGSPARYTNKVKKVNGWNDIYRSKLESNSLTDKDKEIKIVTASQFISILKDLKIGD